ncbi:MAG: NusG domain II-containing protein [Bacillota bacterium]|nr:NusG domain II-containing protein [Bacillota bacterium]
MTRGDKILIVFVLVISILGILFISSSVINGDKKYAVVSVDGIEVKKILVSKYDNNKTYGFEFENEVGYIEVNEGAVKMVEMNEEICPAGICSKTGWISKKYQTIICLPNKIAVEFVNSGEEELDSISY